VNESPEHLALIRALRTCEGHAAVLREDLAEFAARTWQAADLEGLSTADRRLLDQFAFRFTRLQDLMGARLFPVVLRALGEEPSGMPALDRLARLEQIGWLPSADEWGTIRQIRNEFAHDYPETAEERLAKLTLAMDAARRALQILAVISTLSADRFGT